MSEVQEQPEVGTPAQEAAKADSAPVATEVETIPQPKAQETSTVEPQVDAPKVDVPKKFQKEDGSLDTEKVLKSYSELEKKLHNPEEIKARKQVGDILPSVSQPLAPATEPDYDEIYSNPESVIKAAVHQAVAPYEAKLKYGEMVEAANTAKTLPRFIENEEAIVEEIQRDPALNALFRMGDTSVFKKAYGVVLSGRISDIEKSAYERGKNEKSVIQQSVPKVEGASSAPPEPVAISKQERLQQLLKSGASMDSIMLDEALLSPAERKLFGKK